MSIVHSPTADTVRPGGLSRHLHIRIMHACRLSEACSLPADAGTMRGREASVLHCANKRQGLAGLESICQQIFAVGYPENAPWHPSTEGRWRSQPIRSRPVSNAEQDQFSGPHICSLGMAITSGVKFFSQIEQIATACFTEREIPCREIPASGAMHIVRFRRPQSLHFVIPSRQQGEACAGFRLQSSSSKLKSSMCRYRKDRLPAFCGVVLCHPGDGMLMQHLAVICRQITCRASSTCAVGSRTPRQHQPRFDGRQVLTSHSILNIKTKTVGLLAILEYSNNRQTINISRRIDTDLSIMQPHHLIFVSLTCHQCA
ncbi:hypothetical protein QBC37DRAFT_28760 [Rhypophila decipiens]|uniref:Uncharacterized protein n=1 Tax=Rhypophila decipiens TaxID=261697 RepID=A0AAN6Y3M0_9PEZI|nr:hypothetical protein QBC37DRAFT_28760 [Rhypophila decipiens]